MVAVPPRIEPPCGENDAITGLGGTEILKGNGVERRGVPLNSKLTLQHAASTLRTTTVAPGPLRRVGSAVSIAGRGGFPLLWVKVM